MWFYLTLFASLMLLSRRSAEKKLARGIDSLAMAWLQQAFAIPVILITLLFAKFYFPSELPHQFWISMSAYVFFGAIDLFLYFKALSIADISYVAPLMTLTAVSTLIGSYIVLGQVPSTTGFIGAGLIIAGAYIVNKAKLVEKHNVRANRLALYYVLAIVLIRGYYSNLEVTMLRVSNPTSYNFYSSILTVPFVLLIASLVRSKRRVGHDHYWKDVGKAVGKYKWLLLFIGLTYTLNLTATYQAKLLSPVAGYVATIKSAQVLPMMLVGVFFFKEKVTKYQWYGLVLILLGLMALAIN